MGGCTRDDRRLDQVHHAIGVRQHVVVPVSDDLPTFVFKVARAFGIRLRAERMLAAVELDREAKRAAGEVEDIVADDELAGEAGLKTAEAVPETTFGFGGIRAKRSRDGGQLGRCALHRAS